ncbi:uncharacterized protein TNCV_192361, partial [Trichonephila clavipes]
NVCDVRRITIRRDGQVLNTKHLILTFNTPDLPQTVKKWPTSDAQSDHTSRIRCDAFSARDLDILKTVCRGQPTCSRCAEVGHDSADCKAKERCVNCKGDHSSFSRSCPTWLLEKEITALKIKNKNFVSGGSACCIVTHRQLLEKAMRRRPANLSRIHSHSSRREYGPTSATARLPRGSPSLGEYGFHAPEVP